MKEHVCEEMKALPNRDNVRISTEIVDPYDKNLQKTKACLRVYPGITEIQFCPWCGKNLKEA